MGNRGYIIGVDSGTSSTRAILFNELGHALAEGRQAYEVLQPRPGWVEQEAEWWWGALVQSIRSLLQVSPVSPEQIAGLAITHQRITTVPIDLSLQPLRRAILWNDIRCSSQNEWAFTHVGKESIYSRTGYNPGIWTVYKAMWIRDNEPEIYERTYKFILVQDYLTYKLTGELVTTSSSAVMTGCLDIAHKHRWAEDVMDALEVDKSKWIPDILPGGVMAGRLQQLAAQATGLPEGLPIITAAGDQPCGVLGAGIARPSMLGINGGTSCTLETCTEELMLHPEANYFIEISPMGTYYPENSIYSGGSALMNWLKKLLSHDVSAEAAPDWNVFYDSARDVAPGNWGLMLIPYFSGATAPYWDLDARGVMFGFLMAHSQAHLVRAVLEGLAYETRRQAGFMEQGSGVSITEARMYGGSARSPVWNQIFADILDIPILIPKTVETTALGAAICAAKGVGIYPSFEEAAAGMVHIEKEFVPSAKNRHLYDRLYHEVYSKFYDRVQDLVSCASRIVTDNHKL